MNELLKNAFRQQIKMLSGFNFQDFVTELFLYKYGSDDYIVSRKAVDGGCDGIILSQRRVVACHAPENYSLQKFLKKIEQDFQKYRDNWEKKYPNWLFVTNQEPGEKVIKKIHQFKKGTPLLGTENLLAIIGEFDSYRRRKLGGTLRINPDFFAQDYIREIIDDLLRAPDIKHRHVEYSKAVYFPEKVELNFEVEDVEEVLRHFDNSVEYFPRIAEIIQGYDKDIDKIKDRIMNDFGDRKGTFKERLKQQLEMYVAKYSPEDDNYRFYIRAVLLYHFEQCIIGKKTEAEK